MRLSQRLSQSANHLSFSILLLVSLLSLCLGTESIAQNILLQDAFPGRTFQATVEGIPVPGFENKLALVDQRGTIRIVEVGNPNSHELLNINSRVVVGGERGLLGLAFHPNFPTDLRFYVYYTARINNVENSVVSQFNITRADTLFASPTSEVRIINFSQPFSNHNGGSIHFGGDGYLYIASGDGGSGNDPQNNAQNLRNLLGKILRIDIDNRIPNVREYEIPSDNPFRGNTDGNREEIYAYGLRNPWKMSFDRETDRLITADVGQNAIEEINIITNGANYGWRMFEGNRFNNLGSNNREGLTFPVFEYDQNNGDRSITGGYVYRGNRIEALRGWYIYGDYISGNVWALNLDTRENRLLINAGGLISSFMEDHNKELYVILYASGSGRRILKLDTDAPSAIAKSIESIKLQAYPNPITDNFSLTASNLKDKSVVLKVYDALGKEVVNQTLSPQKIEKGYEISVSHWSSGTYNCVLFNGNTISALKVVKK